MTKHPKECKCFSVGVPGSIVVHQKSMTGLVLAQKNNAASRSGSLEKGFYVCATPNTTSALKPGDQIQAIETINSSPFTKGRSNTTNNFISHLSISNVLQVLRNAPKHGLWFMVMRPSVRSNLDGLKNLKKHTVHEANGIKAAQTPPEAVTPIVNLETVSLPKPESQVTQQTNTTGPPSNLAAKDSAVEYTISSKPPDRDSDKINRQDCYGRTALMQACMGLNRDIMNCEVVKELVKKSNVFLVDKKGRTALIHACKATSNEEFAISILQVLSLENCLLSAEACKKLVDVADVDGKTALMYACRNGYAEVAKILIHEFQADVVLRDKKGSDAYIYSCEPLHDAMVEIQEVLSESSMFIQRALTYEYDCFMAHSWGHRNQTHKRIERISAKLRGHGLKPWVDTAQIRRTFVQTIAEGIDKSRKFVVFLTQDYMEKLKNPGGVSEYCSMEFGYVHMQNRKNDVIVVILQHCMLNTQSWSGPFLMRQHDCVFIDFSSEELEKKNFHKLLHMINLNF